MGVFSLWDGNLDNLSAKTTSLTGIYCMVYSYFCNHKSMCCSVGSAAWIGFLWIISRGLWSFCTVTCLPYMYVWNFSSPKHTERHSLYVSISGFNISEGLAGKSYGSVILEECSTETIFTGIVGLQDKGLCPS